MGLISSPLDTLRSFFLWFFGFFGFFVFFISLNLIFLDGIHWLLVCNSLLCPLVISLGVSVSRDRKRGSLLAFPNSRDEWRPTVTQISSDYVLRVEFCGPLPLLVFAPTRVLGGWRYDSGSFCFPFIHWLWQCVNPLSIPCCRVRPGQKVLSRAWACISYCPSSIDCFLLIYPYFRRICSFSPLSDTDDEERLWTLIDLELSNRVWSLKLFKSGPTTIIGVGCRAI